jgi:hypothetical protein
MPNTYIFKITYTLLPLPTKNVTIRISYQYAVFNLFCLAYIKNCGIYIYVHSQNKAANKLSNYMKKKFGKEKLGTNVNVHIFNC